MRSGSLVLLAGALLATTATVTASAEDTVLLWGDTHLHTSYSPDAYFLQNRSADPDTAYRFAKGQPVIHPYNRVRVQLETPLDFLVVTDHAEMMGVPYQLITVRNPEMAATATGQTFIEMVEADRGSEVFEQFLGAINTGQPFEDLDTPEVRRLMWDDVAEAADRHNQPGVFTAFIGWEWTSTPGGRNLHRVVFSDQDAEVMTRFQPFTAFDSSVPEDLWDWLEDTTRRHDLELLAIPHNSNISGGTMFDDTYTDGRPIDAAYGRTRMRWEPVVEIVQVKGDSETHPSLSPDDAFADFETFSHVLDATSAEHGEGVDPGDYVRSGLRRGLEIADSTGVNPYEFGLVGSTDAHTSLSSTEEYNFWGKVALDSIPENKVAPIALGIPGADMSAAGLAAVWATDNSREAIFDAFQRREVYASTGPRISLRVFGGYDFQEYHAGLRDIAEVGYRMGVPMGGHLTDPDGSAPRLLIQAVRDPVGANLDRIQVVKIWSDGSGSFERVYDVALSDGRSDGSVPVGDTVDRETGRHEDSIGDPQLAAVWEDPDFDPDDRAAYYVRVLQIPTARHTLLDAVALQVGVEDLLGHPEVIQERAYSSPIFYTP